MQTNTASRSRKRPVFVLAFFLFQIIQPVNFGFQPDTAHPTERPLWAISSVLAAELPAARLPSQLNLTRDGLVRLPGHVLPALAKATRLAEKQGAGQQLMSLTRVLRRGEDAGFQRYWRDVYDTQARLFR